MNTRSEFDMLSRIVGPHTVPTTDPADSLCPDCVSDRAALVDWSRVDEDWWIMLRCGDCGRWRELFLSKRAALRLELIYDKGRAGIARDLELLDRQRLHDEADIFATALELDLIDADDFALSRD